MRNIIRAIYRATLKPFLKGLLILKSWLIILCRIIFYRILRGIKNDKFEIRVGYITRKNNIHFNDTANKDEHQDLVYKRIKEFFEEKQLKTIVDVGCGSGFKLIKYFNEYKSIGMELPPALDYLKTTYPSKSWIYSDFKFKPDFPVDIAISIDVIEHLKNPDDLLNYFKELNPKYIALCTPDRDKLVYRSRLGPPINIAHLREWNKKEFDNYISKHFEIIESKVVSNQDHYIIAKLKN
jgi:hypothetical protein